MPVTYRIDKPLGLIRTQCAGEVTLEEVLEHFRMLGEDPDCPERLDVLLDLRDMTSLPESDQLRSVAKTIAGVRSRVEFGTCAIVATRNPLFGMTRMFEVFAEDYFSATRVFRDVREAWSWLHETRDAGSGATS